MDNFSCRLNALWEFVRLSPLPHTAPKNPAPIGSWASWTWDSTLSVMTQSTKSAHKSTLVKPVVKLALAEVETQLERGIYVWRCLKASSLEHPTQCSPWPTHWHHIWRPPKQDMFSITRCSLRCIRLFATRWTLHFVCRTTHLRRCVYLPDSAATLSLRIP